MKGQSFQISDIFTLYINIYTYFFRNEATLQIAMFVRPSDSYVQGERGFSRLLSQIKVGIFVQIFSSIDIYSIHFFVSRFVNFDLLVQENHKNKYY